MNKNMKELGLFSIILLVITILSTVIIKVTGLQEYIRMGESSFSILAFLLYVSVNVILSNIILSRIKRG